MTDLNTINIRPGVNVLAVLPHLNYKAWFALAEFVDNSIQSSISRRRELFKIDGKDYQLQVDIDFNPVEKTITITDNAAGISSAEYQRAFRPAEIPPDASGLSEFGMGMKSAACWFAPNWSVRTSALGEAVERTVFFDIDQIVHDKIDELNIGSMVVGVDKHYTEVRLDNIRRFPRGKTVHKIKEHLASIYRVFLREGDLVLRVDGENLIYEEPEILSAPSYRQPDGAQVIWKQDVNIDLGEGRSASGYVAIRKTANTRLAGLSLFRRKRLVLGSVDETYRPEELFGRSNTYPYQRLFGEINLRGFFVSHTKDGVKWEECEDEFLVKLRKAISTDEFPLLQQAREHRSKTGAKANRHVAAQALANTAAGLQDKEIPLTNNSSFESTEPNEPLLEVEPRANNQDGCENALENLPEADAEVAEIGLSFRGAPWIVRVELSFSETESDWLSISDRPSIVDPDPRQVGVRISMLHPFMAQYPTLDADAFSAILRLAAAMGLAEVMASELAEKGPSSIRRLTNEILRSLMSKPIENV
jgi:hypothetical protein